MDADSPLQLIFPFDGTNRSADASVEVYPWWSFEARLGVLLIRALESGKNQSRREMKN